MQPTIDAGTSSIDGGEVDRVFGGRLDLLGAENENSHRCRREAEASRVDFF
jgi:hypothetical protein